MKPYLAIAAVLSFLCAQWQHQPLFAFSGACLAAAAGFSHPLRDVARLFIRHKKKDTAAPAGSRKRAA